MNKKQKIKKKKSNIQKKTINPQYMYIFIEAILTKGLTLFICGAALTINISSVTNVPSYFPLLFNICFIIYALITVAEAILVFYQYSKRKYITPNLIMIIKHYIFKR